MKVLRVLKMIIGGGLLFFILWVISPFLTNYVFNSLYMFYPNDTLSDILDWVYDVVVWGIIILGVVLWFIPKQ